MPVTVPAPFTLETIMGKDLAGYMFLRYYWIQYIPDTPSTWNTFAVYRGTEEAVLCPDKELANSIRERLLHPQFSVVKDVVIVVRPHKKGGLDTGTFLDQNGDYDEKSPEIPLRSGEEIRRLLARRSSVFAWRERRSIKSI